MTYTVLSYLLIFRDILLMVLLPLGLAQIRFDLWKSIISVHQNLTLLFPQEDELEYKEVNEVKFKVKINIPPFYFRRSQCDGGTSS